MRKILCVKVFPLKYERLNSAYVIPLRRSIFNVAFALVGILGFSKHVSASCAPGDGVQYVNAVKNQSLGDCDQVSPTSGVFSNYKAWSLIGTGGYTAGKDVVLTAPFGLGIEMDSTYSLGALSLDAKGNLTINAWVTPNLTLPLSLAGGILVSSGTQDSATFTLEQGATLDLMSSRFDPEGASDGVVFGINGRGQGTSIDLKGATTISVAGPRETIEWESSGIALSGGAGLTSSGGLNITANLANGLEVRNNSKATVSGLITIKQSGGDQTDSGGGAGVAAVNGSSLNLNGDVGSTIEGQHFGVDLAIESTGILNNLAMTAADVGGAGLAVESSSILTGTNLSMSSMGENSYGLYVGGWSTVANLTDVSIETTSSGSKGAYAESGATLTLTATGARTNKVNVEGDKSIGVDVESSGKLTMSQTDVVANGDNSVGMQVNSSVGGADVSNSTVSTTGKSANGISAKNGALTLQGTSISTQGDDSIGMAVSGGKVTINPGVTVETQGRGADGLSVSNSTALVSIAPNTVIATHGENANSFSLTGAGNTYTFDASGLQLANLSAERGALIHAGDGAVLELTQANPFAISTVVIANGVPSSWGAIAGAGGTVQLDDGVVTNGNAFAARAGGTLIFKDGSSAADSIVQLNADVGGGAAGTLDATQHGSTLTVGALSGDGVVDMGVAVTQFHLGSDQATAAGTYVFSGTTQGSADLYKSGSNIQVMEGDAAWAGIRNSYLNGGVLVVTGIADPSAFAKTFYVKDGWLDLSGTSAVFDPAHPDSAADWGNINIQYAGGKGGVIGSNDKIDIADGIVGYHIGSSVALNGAGVYVVKNGAGVSTVTADNTYVGNTQINAGTLQVSRDANLGDTTVEREVRLQGGNLQISKGATDFQSKRAVQVLASGSVIVDADQTATLGSVATYTKDGNGVLSAGGNAVFTKDGGGGLTIGGVDLTGGLVVAGGGLTAGGGEISNGNGGAAISAAGGTSLSLANVLVDGNSAGVYDATSAGTSAFDAGASLLKGDITSSVADSIVNVGLSGGTELTGVISQSNGGQVNVTLADADTVWNLTGDSSVQQLTNKGVIEFSAPAMNGGVAQYKTLSVAGDYTGGGTINLNTELNAGGKTQASNTDKVLIRGSATGTTTLHVTTTGTGANTNATGDNKFHADEGISVAQVGGSASATSFKLDTAYVTSPGSLYQYRLFGYGPGGPNGPADPSQSGITWDYRLQTAYEDDHGNIIPGVPTAPPGPPRRPLVVPQTSSYLIAPLVLQRYNAMLMSGLHARLSDVSSSDDELGGETFARTLGESGSYTSNRSFQQYGFGFDQHSQALQFGGNFLRYTAADGDAYRMGLAATIGSVHATPRATQATSSDLSIQAYSLALTSTWMSAQGWYVDGVLSGSFYRASVDGLSRNAGTLYGTGVDLSLETGRQITLPSGVEIEPHVQFMGQTTHFRNMVDADGVEVSLGNTQAWTTGAGVRVSYPIYSKGTTIKPYADVGSNYTWMRGDKPNLAGQEFTTANVGGGVQLALGVSAQLSDRLQVYGEANGQARPGNGYGNSTVGGNLGLRYDF